MKNLKITLLTIALSSAGISASALAQSSAEDAAKLGNTLTPIGAEKAGNADGSIPEWTGGLSVSLGNVNPSKDSGRPENPFKNDTPLFVINNENLAEHKDSLSPGQLQMFAKYPGYTMNVYQTHRTGAYPQSIYDIAKKNAVNTKLVNDGNSLENFDTTVPFAIPNNGKEMVWNHTTRYRGGSAERQLTQIPVQESGEFNVIKMFDRLVWPEFLKSGRDAKKDDNVMFYYIQKITAPTRLAGSVLLVHETIDQVKEPRRAWVYNAGQRRVRRAPDVAYDGPAAGVDGLRTSDNYDMYNGAPDRYEWEFKGKKELYIPYNSYKLMNPGLKYADIIKKGHFNPEHTRYEKHRVWVVEGKLKKDARHIYHKRVLYIDEDTWSAAVVDHYDGRGELWRLAESHQVQFYDVDTPWMVTEVLYDLVSGRYLSTGLANEEDKFMDWALKAKRKDFTSSALRRMGRS